MADEIIDESKAISLNENKPLVTIIVPCYNHEDYIEQSIRSILEQTYAPIELLVFDDGSTDSSPIILKKLAEEAGFYLEVQKNIGLAATLNKALAKSRGKYICIASSDDIFMPEKVAKQVAYMESKSDIAVCGTNVIAIDAKGKPLARQKSPDYRELNFDQIFLGTVPGIAAPTAMIRKSVLDEVGGYNPEIRLEDMYMWLKITHHGHIIAGLPKALLYYRKHGTNTYKNYAWMTDNMLRTYADYADHPQYNRVVQKYLVSTFIAAAKTDKTFARTLLGKISFWHHPFKIFRGLLYLSRAEARGRGERKRGKRKN